MENLNFGGPPPEKTTKRDTRWDELVNALREQPNTWAELEKIYKTDPGPRFRKDPRIDNKIVVETRKLDDGWHVWLMYQF